MNLRQLESFVRVVELGGFTRAATALHTAQPALSRRIRHLEVELGQSLLIRNGRGATPTEAGQVLLAYGQEILRQVDRAQEAMRKARGLLTGKIAVGLPTSIARVHTLPLARAFKKKMPGATIAIREGLSSVLQGLLLSGHLDIAVLYDTQSWAGIDIVPLPEEELVLVQARPPMPEEAPSLEPIPLRELSRLALVIPRRPNAIRMYLEEEFVKIGCRLSVSLEIDGIPAILDLVSDGAVSAVLPRNAVENSGRPASFIVRAICEPELQVRVSVAISSARSPTPTMQATLELIRHTMTAVER